MEWLVKNASTIVVLLILVAIVVLAVRSMVRGRAGGCAGDCASCGSVCQAPKVKLTPEQEERLRALRERGEQDG